MYSSMMEARSTVTTVAERGTGETEAKAGEEASKENVAIGMDPVTNKSMVGEIREPLEIKT